MAKYYEKTLRSLQPGVNVLLIHTAYDYAEMQGAAWRQNLSQDTGPGGHPAGDLERNREADEVIDDRILNKKFTLYDPTY